MNIQTAVEEIARQAEVIRELERQRDALEALYRESRKCHARVWTYTPTSSEVAAYHQACRTQNAETEAAITAARETGK